MKLRAIIAKKKMMRPRRYRRAKIGLETVSRPRLHPWQDDAIFDIGRPPTVIREFIKYDKF